MTPASLVSGPFLGRHSFAVQSLQDRFDRGYAMGVQNPLFETPVALDFPRQLDEIQCPKPFDVGFRPDVVNHHLADDLANASKVGVATIRRVDRLITTRERSRNNVLKDRERRRQNAAQSAKIEQARMKPATADKADRIKGGKILPWNIIVHGN